MAATNPLSNSTSKAKVPHGQRLLIDTARMTVRRVTKSEGDILSALRALAPVERATLSTVVEALKAKKRKPSAADSVGGGNGNG